MLGRLHAHATRHVPRYTSYPTAPHFGAAVDANRYATWLDELDRGAALSLYLHVPFCRAICHYCGCHTKASRRDAPISAYAQALEREIGLVLRHFGERRRLVHVHWGGGTPSILPADDFLAVADRIVSGFELAPDAEHAMELDPRTVTPHLVTTLQCAGITRVNLGVQDFNPAVQLASGRWQPYDTVAAAVALLREAGSTGVGFDLMYGLPHQGDAEIARTLDLALGLKPDRVAVFGYAHVPWLKKHQRRIDAAALPDTDARLRHARIVAGRLQEAGYVAIGFDHFALPHDDLAVALAKGSLRRNFQGYTADSADALIGVGASAIGRLPQGYVQNVVDLGGWRQTIEAGKLPTGKGWALDAEDCLRGAIIERLLCFLEADVEALCAAHGIAPSVLGPWREALAPLRRDGIVTIVGTRVRVPPEHRLFVRIVASAFDAHLPQDTARHSVAV